MRIGIITFHRAINYGAVLQCYALQEYLKSLGQNVEVIDYRQTYIERFYRGKFTVGNFFLKLLAFHVIESLKLLKSKIKSLFKDRYFRQFRTKYLLLSEKCEKYSIPYDFDCYIIGSDQMWGLHCTGGYDPVYWGEFNRGVSSKLYGYSISSNGDFKTKMSNARICDCIGRFDGLTFREKELQEDIKNITGLNFGITVDPTLLCQENVWSHLICNKWSKKKYVAVYAIRSQKDSIRQNAQELALAEGLHLIDLSEMKYCVNDFVSILKYAQCVYTSSFHAVVFSLIFNTPFWAYCIHDGHDARYVSLLKKLHLDCHIANVYDEVKFPPVINKYVLQNELSMLRASSISYLNSIIK